MLKTQGTSWVKSETGLDTQRARRNWKKSQTTPNLHASVLISKEQTYEAYLESQKMSRSPYITSRILTGLSHVHHPDSLNNNSFLKLPFLWMDPTVGMVGIIYIPKKGMGLEAFNCPDPAQWSSDRHIPLMTSSNKKLAKLIFGHIGYLCGNEGISDWKYHEDVTNDGKFLI